MQSLSSKHARSSVREMRGRNWMARFPFLAVLVVFSMAVPVFTQAGEAVPDQYFDLDLEFPEGFEELEFVSSSQGAHQVEGLVTRDRRNRTYAVVEPDVSTDARGLVTGTVKITVFDDSDSTVTMETIPVSGRTRLLTNTFIRETSPDGPVVEITRMKQHIGLRGRAQGDDGNVYAIALNALSRFGVGNSQNDGLFGNLIVYVSGEHRGRSRVEIAPFELSFAEMVVSKDTVNTATLRRVNGDAVVLSDSLGEIPGGLTRILIRYDDDNSPRPGSYLIHSQNGRFRVIERGWLFITEETAEEQGQDPEFVLDQGKLLFFHASSPSALNLIRYVRRRVPITNPGNGRL